MSWPYSALAVSLFSGKLFFKFLVFLPPVGDGHRPSPPIVRILFMALGIAQRRVAGSERFFGPPVFGFGIWDSVHFLCSFVESTLRQEIFTNDGKPGKPQND